MEPLYYWLLAFGIDMRRFIPALIGLPSVLREYRALKKQNKAIGSKWKLRFTMPVIEDRYSSAGKVSGHYFHQDLLVARRIFQRKPVKHVDVGSRIDGFVAHVAAFRPIEVFDIRPLDVGIPNIIFKHVDLMDPEMELKDYCDSLSCLHVLEHLGLGRYGDQIDINGHLRGFNNLHKLLQRGGFYICPFQLDQNALILMLTGSSQSRQF